MSQKRSSRMLIYQMKKPPFPQSLTFQANHTTLIIQSSLKQSNFLIPQGMLLSFYLGCFHSLCLSVSLLFIYQISISIVTCVKLSPSLSSAVTLATTYWRVYLLKYIMLSSRTRVYLFLNCYRIFLCGMRIPPSKTKYY